MFDVPWRDPVADPPEEYEEILVTTATGRVTSCRYYKGKFSTYSAVIAWQPMPAPAKAISNQGNSSDKKPRAAARRKAATKQKS